MMKEILITSSALILALLVIRRAFRNTLSRRFQYALWGLVLVRLLAPVSLLPAADFSVLTAAQPVERAVAQRISPDRIFYSQPRGQVSREELVERNIDPEDVPTPQDLFVMGESDPDNRFSTNWLVRDPESGAVTRYAEMIVGPWDILDRVWKAGMALMGAFFLLSNTAFYWRLRKSRREWRDEVIREPSPYGEEPLIGERAATWGRPYGEDHLIGERAATWGRPYGKIYLVDQGVIPSPCLFGRSIYITPAVAEDGTKLRHVLAHESTHARHWDPLWALLRCLCLTVYWFDPLVWVAAACSRTDCELACDESVLESLGETERIPYGQTLVSLIPVKRAGNPMIAATTMTAGKKQLRDRVTRIAQKPRQLVAAALAVAVLAGIVSACTFTGGAGEATPELGNPSQGPTESTVRVLTGEELRWFNEEFFNASGADQTGEGVFPYNIRNQFASPVNLYDRPEDIDLLELFYLEGESVAQEEYESVFGPGDMWCPVNRLTEEGMSAILKCYTGLTLEETEKVRLDELVFQNDAYYLPHGDTNYCGDLDFVCGTREGDTVKLYHHSDFAGGGWYCVTLVDRRAEGVAPYGSEMVDRTIGHAGALHPTDEGESPYWFLSNQACEKPVIPTPLPAWGPEVAIGLSVLEPYTAPAVTTERHEGDFVFSYANNLQNWDIDGHHIRVYRSTDGAIYAAEEQEDGAMNVFAQYSFDNVSLFFFHDLFGQDGFTITYQPGANARFYPTDTNYYYFDENGTPALLATCHGDSRIMDLDGDGQNELIAPRQLFFQREGVVYEAQLDEMLPRACPELSSWDSESWDKYNKCLRVWGHTEDYREWTRYLYFDGESLLVYKNEKPTIDHMVAGADEGVPQAVVEKARELVQRLYEGSSQSPDIPESERLKYDWGDTVTWDDWRVDYFTGPYIYSHGGATVEGWQFNYELHTTTPENVVLAGGRYLTEDNWVSPGYPGCDALFFEIKDGEYRFLNRNMFQESMDSYYVDNLVLTRMEDYELELPDGSTYAQLWLQKYLAHLTDPVREGEEMLIQYSDGLGDGTAYPTDLSKADVVYYLNQISGSPVVWSRAQAPAAEPQGPSVTLADKDWYETLRFWRDSGLVMHQLEDWKYPEWFQVTYDGDPAQDVYAYRAYPYYWVRCWFDDTEYERYANRALGDHGDGDYREVALAYLTLYEDVARHSVTPGSRYACSYGKVTDVEILEQPETWFPGQIVEYPHFAFSYRFVFVPENEEALSNLMAGNTGAYRGDDPDVPEGALEYFRQGIMYLVDGYWHCGEIGTG